MASEKCKKRVIRTVTRWSMGQEEVIVIPNPKAAVFRESPGAPTIYLDGFVKGLMQLRKWFLRNTCVNANVEPKDALEAF